MKYLLDTHIILWGANDSEKLNKTARAVFSDINAKIYVSIASLWEFSIKHSMGKLPFEGGLPKLCQLIEQADFKLLPITQQHLEQLIKLPFIHKDPFDRLLIATAQTEDLIILTADEQIYKYDVEFLW